ncbi:type II secretion system F family protein [Planctomycetota bacterium]|nr:type II secretion system F family protein [Planctomycetota bacterium]
MISTSTFDYEAIDGSGKSCEGQISAGSREQAIANLAGQGVFVTQMAEIGGHEKKVAGKQENREGFSWPSGNRVSAKQMLLVWRQLATGVEAGLSLLETLQIVEQQSDVPAVKALLGDLANRVKGGESMSDAMKAHSKVFSKMQVSMVAAGETAGMLEKVFESLVGFAERENEIKRRVQAALFYPVIVLAVAVISVIVILVFVIPTIIGAVSDSSMVLPLPTRMLLVIRDVVVYWGWLVLGLSAFGYWRFKLWTATEEGLLKFDAFKLRLPIVGNTIRKIAVARFARTLGTMAKSGINILEALSVLRDSLGNEALAVKTDEVKSGITQGQSIAKPLEETGEFPPMFIQVIALGEKTGRLDEMLIHAADAFDKDTEVAIDRLMVVLPTLIILVLAVVVGFILLSVLLPILEMQTAITGV